MKTSRLTRREIRRGASDQRKRSRNAARTYHEPCCWSELDYEGVEASGHEPVRKLWATEGELVSSRESLLAIGGMRAETRLRQGVKANAHEPVRKLWTTKGSTE